MTLLNKLISFYLGLFLGYLTFKDPSNVWVYGFFGGAILFLLDTRENK